MSRKANGRNYSMTVPAKRRRKNTLNRRKNQLQSGLKLERDDGGKETGNLIPLTDKDVKRINKEIKTLEERI